MIVFSVTKKLKFKLRKYNIETHRKNHAKRRYKEYLKIIENLEKQRKIIT